MFPYWYILEYPWISWDILGYPGISKDENVGYAFSSWNIQVVSFPDFN
jgi:hypothetical protein